MRHRDYWIPKPVILKAAEHLPDPWIVSTVHVNHEDCPAGRDTKRRLYVTRTDRGVLLAYCHHCNGRGCVRDDEQVTSIYTDPLAVPPKPQGGFPLHSIPHISGAYPISKHHSFTVIPEIKEYFEKYGITPEATALDMWYHTTWNHYFALIHPYYLVDGDYDSITGCQLRVLAPEKDLATLGMPKIKTYGDIHTHIHNPHDSETVVLCEDRVSGVKLAMAGYAACVMNGSTSISPEKAHKISAMFDRIIVWYDNDSAIVCTHAEESVRSLRMFHERVGMVTHLDDPKKHSLKVIQAVVEDVL